MTEKKQEAPERIYIVPDLHSDGKFYREWVTEPRGIEYVRSELLQSLRDDARLQGIQAAHEYRQRRGLGNPKDGYERLHEHIDYLLSLLQQPATSERCGSCGHFRNDPRRRGSDEFSSFCIRGCGCGCVFPATEAPDYRERNQEALRRFRTFGRGWDSYNGSPINQRAIEIAERLVHVLPEWQVVPGSDGSIQFDGPDDAEIQIEVATTGAGAGTERDDRYKMDDIDRPTERSTMNPKAADLSTDTKARLNAERVAAGYRYLNWLRQRLVGPSPEGHSENQKCPFCNEEGFDLIGLKSHLQNGDCEEFENLERIQRLW